MDEKVNAGDADSLQRTSTGIPGLDEVLLGGFLGETLYLIQGNPGSGKTTLGMQFLIEGARHGETGLYVTFSESKRDIQGIAKSHGWSLDGITLYESEDTSPRLKAEEEYTVFPADEVELSETTNRLYEEVERLQPRRVVVDSLSELRLMAKDPRRYRQQILFFKQFFSQRGCTVLLLDDQSGHGDLQIQTVSHGVIELQRHDQQYGVSRRQLRIIKVRGAKFHDGLHDYVIQRGGLVVFPRLVAAEHRDGGSPECLPSGLVELDALLGGGLGRGTSALLLGPPGAGKSALVMQYAFSRVEEGEAVACFVFEESRERFLNRAARFGRDLRSHVDAGRLTVRQIDPAELSPGEFAYTLKASVEEHGVRLVIIDSLNGYLNAMPNERFLMLHMHDLLMYLNQQGVLTLMTMTQHGVLAPMQSPVDVSHLADNVILLRYFEAHGEIKQAISVVKNRDNSHERTIREFQITPAGVRIGQPLRQFRGVLSGVPVYSGKEKLLDSDDNAE
jgi:circadian clock protein KaiC